MNSIKQILESKILPFVDKPMRYTGSELNIIHKNLKECTVHGVLCFPDLYDIGMSHFGIQMLYHIVNSEKRWALSRCFHPWTDMEKLLRQYALPLYNLEYFTSLSEADWIGFSVQYELQYTNLLNMLDLAEIPLHASQRGENHPLIIAGGPCMGNPEPLSQFVDVFAIGDGEQTIIKICELIEKRKNSNCSKTELLQWLSDVPGVYIPSRYTRKQTERFAIPEGGSVVRSAKVTKLLDSYYPVKSIVPLMEVVHHRLAVEVMRGCTRGCRFCAAGMWYRPVRERQPVAIVNSIRSGILATGWQEIGLLSLSTADYSCLWSLLGSVQRLKSSHKMHAALPSTRIDALSDEQLDLLDKVSPMMSLTIAPEAGSERLRKVINKDFTDDIIYEIVKKLLKRNVQTLKLYFMIGLPTETDEDITAIVTMVSKIAGMMHAVSRRREVHVALSPFSPKPHTPFQWERMESADVLESRSRAIKNSCRHLKNVKVSYRNPHVTFLETISTRGDERIGNVIYRAWKNGARFDGWDEFFNIDRWRDAAREEQVSLDSYCEKIPDGEKLPWTQISSGVSEAFLMAEKERAINEVVTPDCRHDTCIKCGVCGKEVTFDFADTEKASEGNVLPVNEKKLSANPVHTRYRMWFSKGVSLRFLGHLDMSSLIQRAFLMAGVKIAYSQGFHPHPRISFGPPLPLGVYGINEAFDIVTTAPFTDLNAVNALIPEELKIIRYETVDQSQKSLFEQIRSAHYKFTPLFSFELSQLQSNIQKILESKSYLIQYEKNGKLTEKDIRSGINTIECSNDNKSFIAELSFGQSKNCKPLELVMALFPEKIFSEFLVERVSCNLG